MQYSRGNQQITVEALLKRPDVLTRELTDISKKGFLVDALLQTGYNAQGGAIPYTRSASIYLDRNVRKMAEGTEYPIAGQTDEQLEEKTQKYGLATFLTEEAVMRNQIGELDRSLRRLKNTLVRDIDTDFITKLIADSAILTATASNTASGGWVPATETVFDDLAEAIGKIAEVEEGYEPDTLVVTRNTYTKLLRNKEVRKAFEANWNDAAPPIYTGQMQRLMGLDIMVIGAAAGVSNDIALVLQRKIIGGIADEIPLQVRQPKFDDSRDVWWVRGRRLSATFLQEPKAICKIGGVNH